MRPSGTLLLRALFFLLQSAPYFSVAYVARRMFGLDRDAALLVLLTYMLCSAGENIAALLVRRISPPTRWLIASLTADFLFGVSGAFVGLCWPLTLAAVLGAFGLGWSWYCGVCGIVERAWSIPRALASKDPDRIAWGQERRALYVELDQGLLNAGWQKDE